MVVKPGSRVHDVAGGCSGPFLLFTKRQYTEQLRDTQGEQLLDMLRSQQHLILDQCLGSRHFLRGDDTEIRYWRFTAYRAQDTIIPRNDGTVRSQQHTSLIIE